MNFLLDTNICSAHMRRPARLAHRFIQHVGQLAIPTIVLGELYSGAYGHSSSAKLISLIDDLLLEVQVLDFDANCAEEFGKVRGTMRQQGIAFNSTDLMIGAVALVYDLTLVTNNVKDFKNIPGLQIVDWLTP